MNNNGMSAPTSAEPTHDTPLGLLPEDVRTDYWIEQRYIDPKTGELVTVAEMDGGLQEFRVPLEVHEAAAALADKE